MKRLELLESFEDCGELKELTAVLLQVILRYPVRKKSSLI